jgi:NlpC/P60 family protein
MTINICSRACERIGLLLVLCAVVPGASAERQNAQSSEADRGTVRESAAIEPWLVKPDEGLGIIGAALESRHTDANADCSNLVHEIYGRAGFTYSYANSNQLYRGIKEFRRVLHAQPGDLVAWPGHVGIVISPVQHSFFSAMRSGRGVEFYDSPYWQARGRPRFFRYLKAASRNQLSAARRKADLRRAELNEPAADEGERTGSGVSGTEAAAGASTGGGRNKNEPGSGASGADGVGSAKVSGANPPTALPAVDGQEAALHKSENQTAPDGNRPTRHKIQGVGDGVWEKTATKPAAGIPFGSEGKLTQQEARLPRGSGATNLGAAAGHAVPKAPSESLTAGHESRPEPTQWAMSRYVPRPPWASSGGRTSPPSVVHPPAGRVPRAIPGYGVPGWQVR